MHDHRGLAKRFHAWALASLLGAYEQRIAPRKERLLAPLRGTILEIGPGVGANLRFYHQDVRWVGVEPNAHAREYLLAHADELGRGADVRAGTAEALEADDQSVDAVVGTLVLCSVPDPARTLAEVRRVLRPGGRYVFIEHVVAEEGTLLRQWQRLLRRPWECVADGCRPDQDTLGLIEAAGFAKVEVERFAFRAPLVGPHISGCACNP